jgi:DNA mismatch repair protein MutS
VDDYKQAANVHLDAVEHDSKNGKNIVFLHKVEAGAAHMSYGIQVAQLAGIPKPVLLEAKRKLKQLENQQIAQNNNLQPDMFATQIEPPIVQNTAALSALEVLQPDELTPKQALELLYQLKNLLN